jgi:hypothetical protein
MQLIRTRLTWPARTDLDQTACRSPAFLSFFPFPKASSIALASFLFGDERLTPPTDPLRPAADVTPACGPCGTNILRRTGRRQAAARLHARVGGCDRLPPRCCASAVQVIIPHDSAIRARHRLSFWLNQNHMNEISRMRSRRKPRQPAGDKQISRVPGSCEEAARRRVCHCQRPRGMRGAAAVRCPGSWLARWPEVRNPNPTGVVLVKNLLLPSVVQGLLN